MRYAFTILAFLFLCSLSAQDANVIDQFTTIRQPNDTTWHVRGYQVNQYSIIYQDQEYTYLDTVLIPGATALFDSAGIIQYLTVSTTNEQAQQAAITARSFEVYTRHRNVVDAQSLIDQISTGTSNFFEETSKLWENQLTGTYRLFVDSSGTRINFYAKMSLLTNVAHPDGRIMRLSRCTDQTCETLTGQFWNVSPYHRWKWRIANFFGENPFYVWDRISTDRPLYWDDRYALRQRTNRIIKIN